MKKGTIDIRDISKTFVLDCNPGSTLWYRIHSAIKGTESKRTLHVLSGISLQVKQGEVIGLIGSNGAGKSTLLRAIAGIYKPDSGSIAVHGSLIPIMSTGVGLMSKMTMKENIELSCALLNMKRGQVKKKLEEIVEFSELEEFLHVKLYQFSSGMHARLGFSIAVHCDADILLLDEILATGDEKFHKKAEKKIIEILDGPTTIILASHDLGFLQKVCNKVLWLERGQIKGFGDPTTIINQYQSQ